MATEGDGVTGEDGQGQGGDGNPPTTQASEESGADGGNDSMARGPRTAAAPRLRYTAADNKSAGALPRQPDGADSARPESSTHPCHKYGLLAPEELEEGQVNSGTRARGGSHGATRGTADKWRTETPTEY